MTKTTIARMIMNMTDTLKKEVGSVQTMGLQSSQSRDIGPRSVNRKSYMEGSADYSMYSLRVVQQPERARLCSFKEENETSESYFDF
jgi:hypothetical protein